MTRLVPKVDGVPSVDELRPITLLNCDYKILSKWLVRRMKPVLPSIIKSGQLCTVGKKNILFGVNNILSSILDVQQRNSGACLMTLDFFKAYDRVFLKFLIVHFMDYNATRGGYDKIHYLWTDQGHPVIVFDPAGGPDSNVALYYLYRATTSCSGEEDDRLKGGGHRRKEFGGVL